MALVWAAGDSLLFRELEEQRLGEVVLELRHHIDDRVCPIAHFRVQAPARGGQHRTPVGHHGRDGRRQRAPLRPGDEPDDVVASDRAGRRLAHAGGLVTPDKSSARAVCRSLVLNRRRGLVDSHEIYELINHKTFLIYEYNNQ